MNKPPPTVFKRIPLQLNKLRWNFRKATWDKFSEAAERSIPTIPLRIISVEESFKRFCGAIFKAATANIPRGRRPVYTPCLDAECGELLEEFERSGDPDIADHLLESLDVARKRRWEESTAGIDFTHSSRKAWSLIRRLGAAQQPPTFGRSCVTANQVASHLIKTGKAPVDRGWRRQVHDEWRQLRSRNVSNREIDPFTPEEVSEALSHTKSGTAMGYDNIAPEFMKHLGPRAVKWFASFLSRITSERSMPRIWRRSKVIAILKPGKDPHSPSSYRPISLLSVCFKVLERLILRRVTPDVEEILSADQAGFRPGRSTCDQVLALTTFIENGFQRKMKTGAVLLDLTAAYDTVWHTGLLLKLAKALPFWVADVVGFMLRDRRIRVHIGEDTSRWRLQSNGLPQGSVLAPTLFNMYTNDLPATSSRKFIYADDICCCSQAKSFEELEKTLTEDMDAIAVYCRKWRLQPSVAKTVSCVFHLHNANANRKIDVRLNGQSLKCETKPVYLGVTLDRSLTYHDHLMKTAAKVRTRNNIISRLAGSTWGAQTSTLRTAALALCFSVAEYCAPVWCRSAHVNLVDVQLNTTLRTITGTLRSTPLPWLPVLSNIVPASFRRQEAVSRVIGQIQANTNLPSFEDIFNPPRVRLLSRHPVWLALPGPEFSSLSSWKEDWSDQIIWNGFLVADPSVRPPGFDLVRSDWVSLNRYRTGHGRCAASLHQWGIQDNPFCSCGSIQTMSHIVDECPLTKFNGGLRALHSADGQAVEWLRKRSAR